MVLIESNHLAAECRSGLRAGDNPEAVRHYER